MIGCKNVLAGPCVQTDLGQFSICVPTNWTRTGKGIDSVAGKFVSDGLTVSFDFGLHSDPLAFPRGSTAAKEFSDLLDGRAARHVTFTVRAIHFAGVNVPNVRMTEKGPLRLTLLAQATDEAKLRAAETAFSTVRFRR